MNEGDALSFRTNSRLVVDKLNTARSTSLESRVEIVHREADVMNAGASPGDEFSNW
jgi:hypothetical protein